MANANQTNKTRSKPSPIGTHFNCTPAQLQSRRSTTSHQLTLGLIPQPRNSSAGVTFYDFGNTQCPMAENATTTTTSHEEKQASVP